MRSVALVLCVVLNASLESRCLAVEPVDASAMFQSEAILTGLNNPWGIVLRPLRSAPGEYSLFIAESGAGRVLMVQTHKLEQAGPLIDGFATGPLGPDSALQVGPMGLRWITPSKLAVTTAIERVVSVYGLPQDAAKINADDYEHDAGLTSAAVSISGQGITSVATTELSAFFVTHSPSPADGLLRAEIAANRLKRIQPFRSDAEGEPQAFPVGLAVTPRDRPPFLVVARQPVSGANGGSRLTFYAISTEKVVLDLEVPLTNMSALAYSRTGNLYALDTAWNDPSAGAVYRLDDALEDGRQVCRVVKVANLPRPVGLVFANSRKLYVTTLGAGENESTGSVFEITGEF